MTVDPDAFKQLNAAYEQIVSVLDEQKLTRPEAVCLLTKMLVQLVVHDVERESFINQVERAYNLERFMRPTPKEIH